MPTPRCAVHSLAQPVTGAPGGSADDPVPAEPTLLRTLDRTHRAEVPPYGYAACFGVYATVVHGGTVTSGLPATVR